MSLVLWRTLRYVEFLQQAIVSSHEINCPLRTTGRKKKVPWWNLQLGKLHPETGKPLNKAKRTGVISVWGSFKEAQEQNKRINWRSMQASWRIFCQGVNDILSAQDSATSSLRIPGSDLGLFCFLLGNIHPQERRH
jgi:hypothetical protein